MLKELKAAHAALAADCEALDEDDTSYLSFEQVGMRAEFMFRAFDAVPGLLEAVTALKNLIRAGSPNHVQSWDMAMDQAREALEKLK